MLLTYSAVMLSAALGGFVQSITGFGAAVVMMTLFPYFFGMAIAPSVSTSICLGLTLVLSWKFRKYANLRITLPPTLLYAVSSTLAIHSIGSMDLHVLTIVFGVFLTVLGAWLLFGGNKAAFRVTPLSTIVCGLIAGVCGGLFSIGGPIMAVYYLAATDTREEYIGNAQMNFAVNNVVNITSRIAGGYYTPALLPFTVLGFTGILIGQRFGLRLGGKLNAEQMRRLVYLYVMISGVVTIIQQLV